MAYVKDIGTPGNNNAVLPIGAVLDTTAKTLSLEEGTDLDSFVVLNDRQWLILETRNVNGTANLIGECSYSEDPTKLADVLTFANGVRDRMIALHTSFDITVTHYRLEGIADVYRGDELTAVTLDALDTGIGFSYPLLWSIDDTTPFAPNTPSDDNIVIDTVCDDDSKWDHQNSDSIVTGGKLEFTGTGRAYPDLSEPLVDSVTYEFGIDCEALFAGSYRFYIGDTAVSDIFYGLGTITAQLTCPIGETNISIQGISDCVGTFDNFTCRKV